MTAIISVREVSDVTYRLLRVAGVSSGCAMRAAAMVQHAEVYHGIGLRMLHRQLVQIEGGAADPSGIEVSHGPEGALLLDAAGGTALAAGPPALDLACAGAMERGVGVVWIQNAYSLSFLDELAYRAAASGLVCVLSWTAAEPGGEPLGESRTVISGPGSGGPIGVERTLPGPSSLVLAVAGLLEDRTPATENGGKLIAELLSAVGEEGARKLIEQSLSGADPGGIATPAGAAFVCARAPKAPETWFEPLLRQTVEQSDYRDARIRTRTDLDRAWEEVCASGVELDEKTWHELYEAAGRMLVPEPQNSAW